MKVVVLYDIDTHTAAGQKRLQRMAKHCLNWGVRIQNSVYECEVNAAQYREMTGELYTIIDETVDRLRFYNLGSHYESRIEYKGLPTLAESGFIL